MLDIIQVLSRGDDTISINNHTFVIHFIIMKEDAARHFTGANAFTG